MKETGMKIYIIQDEEGAAGVVRWEEKRAEGQTREALLEMTREVNAAVEGALRAGAIEVYVHESHPFVHAELHPDARCVRGHWIPLFDSSFDGLFFVGQHARARTPNGVLAHSYSSKFIREMRLNDQPIGELGFLSILAGRYGIPVGLVTGDRAVTEEARELLKDVETVAVKEGLGITSAVCLSPLRAQEMIRQAACRAAERLQRKEIAACVKHPPYVLTIDFTRPEVAERCTVFPGAEQLDVTTVRYAADDYLDICKFRRFQAMVNWF